MYRRTACSDTYPTDAAKYDGDHNTLHRASQENSRRNTRAVRPFNLRTTSAAASTRRTRTKTSTGPGTTSFPTITQSFSTAIRSNSSFSRRATRPPSSRRRYFGHHTRCNPNELTPPAERRNRETQAMPAPYETPPTPTDIPWPGVPIPPTAKAASPPGTL